ncbi:MAG: nitroreductase family protein [Candidatus Bathyarchaeota archaeon]
MEYSDFLGLVEKRRSIRRFKKTAVSRDLVQKILDVARWAPSGANFQPWEFIVVDDTGVKAQLSEILSPPREGVSESEVKRRTGFKEAPVFILVCGDSRTKSYLPSQDPERGNNTFVSSMASVFLYIQLAVRALGLGSQWVSSVVGKQAEIKSLVGIPDVFQIYDMAAIGYAEEEPTGRTVRKLNDLIHYNRFDQHRFKSEKELAIFVQELRQSTR